MTLKDIDALLASWKARLAAAAQNLVDLRSHPTYQKMAVEATGTLFQRFDLIQQAVDQAAALRNDWPIFGADERIREIEKLLLGKSIQLPAIPIPIEERGLLSAVENVEFTSPEELMQSMVAAFESARDAVFALEGARPKLTELARAHDRSRTVLAEYQEKVTDYGVAVVALPEDRIDGLRQWLERIEEKSGEGFVSAIMIGIQRWTEAADNGLKDEQKVVSSCQEALDMRNELRGRLDALKAKARAYGIAEDPAIAALAREAQGYLYSRPAPLRRAESLIQQYQARLQTEPRK